LDDEDADDIDNQIRNHDENLDDEEDDV